MRLYPLVLLTLFLCSDSLFAATTTGTATQTVVATLKITRISDLNFGQAEQGAQSYTIPPGQSDTPENASFLVSGEPLRQYQITLPDDVTVTMITKGGGTPQKEIPVQKFKSYPANTGQLNQKGQQTLLVGATRPALLADQQPGLYEGQFTVCVVY